MASHLRNTHVGYNQLHGSRDIYEYRFAYDQLHIVMVCARFTISVSASGLESNTTRGSLMT